MITTSGVTTHSGGNETLHLGAGDDTATLVAGHDTLLAGDGLDTMILDWSNATTRVYMGTNPALHDTLGGFNGSFYRSSIGWYATFNSVERFVVTTGSGNDELVTATGDDVVRLGLGDDHVDLGTGRDEAHGGEGIDGLAADYSGDAAAILWDLQADSYSGSGRVFTGFEYLSNLRTGAGDDVIVTTIADRTDVLALGAGDDRATLVAGHDRIDGDVGDDTMVLDWSHVGNRVYMGSGPGENGALGGFDGAFYRSSVGWYATFTSIEHFEISSGSGDDTLVTAAGDDIVRGNAGHDDIYVQTGNDRADGGADVDRISADYRGDATAIIWNLQTDSYSGGDREFTGFEQFGTLRTGSGNDRITTSSATVHDGGNETLHLGAGNDIATSVAGHDAVYGDLGTDKLILDWSYVDNRVYMGGGPGENGALGGFDGSFYRSSVGWYASFNSVEQFEISTGGGDDTLVTATGNDIVRSGSNHDDVYVGSGRDIADGGADIDRISADYSTDTTKIVWNLQTNSYSGGGRSFVNFEQFGTLRTGSGDDVITTTGATVHSGGNEILHLGEGDDTATLVAGHDAVFGGSGDDTMVLDWSAATTRIYMGGGPAANAALGGFDGSFYRSSIGWYASFNSVEHARPS